MEGKGSSMEYKMQDTHKISTALRWLTNGLALLTSFLYSGIIFGWAALELILLREGQYSELCSTEQDSPCAAQTLKLNVIFTLATFFLSFVSLPVGIFLDYAPKSVYFVVAAVFLIAGLVLFALSDSQTFDFFALAYSLMAVGGNLTMLGSFPASFLLPRYQAGILAAVSCLFDASSIVFFVFRTLNLTNLEIFNRQNLFFGLAWTAVVFYGALACCWVILEKKDWKAVVAHERKAQMELDKGNEETDKHPDPHCERIDQIGMHNAPLAKQLCTFDFTLALIFASLNMLRCNFYIMSVDSFLASIGDQNAFYANIFSFVLPAGVVMVPFIEATVSRMGILPTLQLTNWIGVFFGVLLLVPSLSVQTLDFAVFACFRAYLYASYNTYVALTFGIHTMGRIIGVVYTNAAVVGLLQYPAVVLAEDYFHGNFTVVNLIMLGLGFIPLILSMIYEKKTLGPKLTEMEPLASYGTIAQVEEGELPFEFGSTPLIIGSHGSSLTRSMRMSGTGTDTDWLVLSTRNVRAEF